MRHRLSVLVLCFLVASGLVLSVPLLSRPALADSWTQVNPNGFGTANNESIMSAVSFDEELYAGTQNASGCGVYRYDGGTSWTSVSPLGLGDADNESVNALVVHEDQLYAGTENYADRCQVWRYDGGTSWTKVSTNGFGTTNDGVSSMVVFSDALYAGTLKADGCRVYRYDGGTSWTKVSTNGFGSGDGIDVTCLAEFDSGLYAAVANFSVGCQIWRYNSGTSWTKVSTNGFGGGAATMVGRLAVFDSGLYAATDNRCRVYRYDGGTSWTKVNDDDFNDPDNLQAGAILSAGSNLFVGTQNDTDGCQVWRYDGSNWVRACPNGFGDAKNRSVESLVTCGSTLYAGTWNDTTGGEVWKNEGLYVPEPTLESPGWSYDGSAVLWGHVDATDATVKVFRGSTLVDQPTVNRYGNYRVDLSGLSDGTYTYHAVAYHGGIESIESDDAVLIVSQTAPGLGYVMFRGVGTPTVYSWMSEPPGSGDAEEPINLIEVQDTDPKPPVMIPMMQSDALTVNAGFAEQEGIERIENVRLCLVNEQDSSRTIEIQMAPCRQKHVWRNWQIGAELQTKVFEIQHGTSTLYGNKRSYQDRMFAKWDAYIRGDTPQERSAQEQKISLSCSLGTIQWLIDPSGHVYDEETGRRVVNAQATVEKAYDGQFYAWPAHQYYQENPQYTSFLGDYGWDVAEGSYRVSVERDDYQDTVSETVDVPPEVTDLYIPLTRTGPRRYYFAEGCTRAGFEEWICLENAEEEDANVTITYMLGTGENLEQTLVVPAKTRETVSVNDFVGPDQDVSATVTSDQLLIAERPMYFDYKGTWTGGHDVVGAESPQTDWYFAEGCTRFGFETWLCIQNPTETEADVSVTYFLGTGETQVEEYEVGPMSRKTIDVNADVGADQDVSAFVESTNFVPLVVERPVYFNYRDKWTGGHDVIGALTAHTDWYFAEGCTRQGFEEWICLQNDSDAAASVDITYMLGTGENIVKEHAVPATSRYTVDVNADVGPGQDVSALVESDVPIIAERPIYFDYRDKWEGGHTVVGATYTKDVYFLAEGCTREGFEEWICLQNPCDEDSEVEITYMLENGENKIQSVTVPATRRYTVDVAEFVGEGHDVSARVVSTNQVPIICERPMYFLYRGTEPGGHDVTGF